MKRTIKINFFSSVSDALREQVNKILEKKYNVEITDDFDYCFVNETVYHDARYLRKFLNFGKKECIRILMCGEAVYPDLNIFDYAVGKPYSHIFEDDRIIYNPYLAAIENEFFDSISEFDNSKAGIPLQQILNKKKKFCNFIYSNSYAHKMRDDLFYAISKYKRVDSLGAHLKNTIIEDTRQEDDWGRISIRLKSPYKFSIAAENACFAGYTSEKLITSMIANTIPIYWGNPYVGELYNTKSFINAMDYSSMDDLIRYIAEVDQNDDLWCEIMSQPWRTQEQIDKLNADIEKFYSSFYGIFEKDVKDARRRLEGNNLYFDFFLKI